MEIGEYKVYKGGILDKLLYKFHPILRMSEDGILERYEHGKWVPDSKSNARNVLLDQMSLQEYLQYVDTMKKMVSDDKTLVMAETRTWYVWMSKSKFTLISLSLSIMSLYLKFPLGLIVGIPLSLISLSLNYLEVTKPMFLQTKKKSKKDIV